MSGLTNPDGWKHEYKHESKHTLKCQCDNYVSLTASELDKIVALPQPQPLPFKKEGHDGPGLLTRVIFPTNEFYIFVPLVPTCDLQF